MIIKTLLSCLLVIFTSGCISTLEVEDDSKVDNLNQEYSLIKFEKNKSEIKERNDILLINSLRVLAYYPDTKINLEGRASTEGDNEYNLNLSKERTEKVVVHLEEKGIDESRMEHTYYGEDKQIQSHENELKLRNRSVNLIIKK